MTISTIPIRPTISLRSVSTSWLVVGSIFGVLVIVVIMAIIIAVVIIYAVILCKRKKSLRYFITFLCQHIFYFCIMHVVNLKT